MHMLIQALLLAVLLPGEAPAREPTCKATLNGRLLTTTIKFENGYGLEAPWLVTQTRRELLAGDRALLRVDLSLDRIVEFDEVTGQRSTTSLAHPVQVQVEGSTQPEVVTEAADTWCSSVLKARGGPERAITREPLPKPGRIA